MSVISCVKNIIIKSPWVRELARGLRQVVKEQCYRRDTKGITTDEKTVFFMAFNGRSYSCNPKAVYEYMSSCPEYQDYRFIWAFNEPEKYRELNGPRTKVVKVGSRSFHRAMKRSKYWIVNFRLFDYLHPTTEQIYVQCWHGTPLKRLGYDLNKSDNAMNSIKEIRKKYRTDKERFRYLVSPSTFASRCFASAWNLSGEEGEKLLEIGYPRNDYLSNYPESDVRKIKEKLGIADNDKKVLLYAPTWRDNQYAVGEGYTYQLQMNMDHMRRELGDQWILLCRLHYLVANGVEFDKYQGFVYDVSDYDDINHLYVISDALITDYSSVFFDYAILQRPVFFYMYDKKVYAEDLRGFYLPLEELPGVISETEEELIASIKEGGQAAEEKYRSFHEKYHALEDGKASMRLVEKIRVTN